MVKCTEHKSDHFYHTLGTQSGGINYIRIIWQPLPPFASRTLSVPVGNQHSLKKNCSFPPPPSPGYLQSTSAPIQLMAIETHSRRLIQSVLLWQCCILTMSSWFLCGILSQNCLPSQGWLILHGECFCIFLTRSPIHGPWELYPCFLCPAQTMLIFSFPLHKVVIRTRWGGRWSCICHLNFQKTLNW